MMSFSSKLATGSAICFVGLIFSTIYFYSIDTKPQDLIRRDVSAVNKAANDDARPKFTFDDVFGSKFSYKSITPRWISGNEYVFSDSDQNVYLRNAETMEDQLLMNGTVYKEKQASGYKVSSTQEYILLLTERAKGWRHSYNGTYLVFEVDSQTFLPNDTLPNEVQYITWSPKGNALVYVKGFDIYYRENILIDNDIPITYDGRANYIYNGIPDWVYEEEMISSNNVIYISPDGSKLAFAKFDDSNCSHIEFIRYGEQNQYPQLVDVSYPKAGETQPTSQVFICDLSNATAINCRRISPQQSLIDNGDYLFNRVVWASETRAAVLWCDRAQTWSVMSLCDYQETNRSWICFEHKSYEHMVTGGWLYQRRPYWIPVFGRTTDEFFKVLPDENGWQHVARIDENGKEFQTEGTYTVTSESASYPSVYFYHKETDYVYFLATIDDPGKRQIYRIKGRVPASNVVQCVSCVIATEFPDRCDYVTGSFSKDGSYVVLRCRGEGAPVYAQYFVNHTETDASKILIDRKHLQTNAELVDAIENTQMSSVFHEKFQSTTSDYEFYYEEWRPPNFNPTKKYPLLIDVYAGPGYQNVDYLWTRSWAPRYVPVGLDVVVVRVDGRGSNFRGDKFMHEVYRALGQKEIEDQVEAARYFSTKPYIDENRIAIWGWSYGGFSTSHAIGLDSGVIKCGLAVAPLTDWKLYDTIYAERYMGLPIESDNLAGYEKANVMNKAASFSNSKFFLIHGMTDDNVHFQNAALLEKALVKENVDFNNFFYANQDHSINVGNARKHVYKILTKQLCECFDINVPDDIWKHT